MKTVEAFIPRDQIESVMIKYQPQLSGQLRYVRFISGENPEDWVQLLGPDVIGLTHPLVTAKIMDSFIEINNTRGIVLSTEEKALLMTAAYVHDWGELIIDGQGIGDITFEQKTESHETTELNIFSLLLNDVEDEYTKNIIDRAYKEIVFDKATKLGKMFNAAERIGYLQTGMIAFQGVNGRRIANWRGLTGNVLSNQIEKLLAYAKEYPYVKDVLDIFSGTIDQVFWDPEMANAPLDNEGCASYDLGKFDRARKAWSTAFL